MGPTGHVGDGGRVGAYGNVLDGAGVSLRYRRAYGNLPSKSLGYSRNLVQTDRKNWQAPLFCLEQMLEVVCIYGLWGVGYWLRLS